MKRHFSLFLLAIGFDLYWLLVVMFRERGQLLWLALAILACILLPSAYRLYALLLAVAGGGLDILWGLSGLIHFQGAAPLPLWLMALWLMFAAVWTRLTYSTTLPGWVLALIATCGGPVAYLAGAQLGAMTFVQPVPVVMGAMAAGWLALMLAFHILMGKRQ